MRYRALSPTGDYVFGKGPSIILTNTPETVGQAIYTRLRLQLGEMFFATDEGVPFTTQVIGYVDQTTRDQAFMNVILTTPNVTSILAFDSAIDPATRRYAFTATVQTAYGATTVSG